MKVDNTLAEVLIKVAKDNNTDPKEVMKIMDAFYSGLARTIDEHRADIIKVPFFGKFIYNFDRKKKVEMLFSEMQFND